MVAVRSEAFVPRRNLSERTRENIRVYSRKMRADRKADGLCVNGHTETRARTYGCRCFECWLVHRLGRLRATDAMERAVARCIGCTLLVPTGYGEFLVDIGMFHKRCAEQLYTKEPCDGC